MNREPSPKLCECGCGLPTQRNARTRGAQRKGDSQRWIRGHWARGLRVIVDPPNPSGLCQCGCGEKAPIAVQTDSRLGYTKGEPVRFIVGHAGYLYRQPEITEAMFEITDQGYDTPCWLWSKPPDAYGYARAQFNGVPNQLVHRVMYEQAIGPIPPGLHVDHLCRNRTCIRPTHLEPVTPAENVRRGRAAKLSVEKVRVIRASPLAARKLAAQFGVTLRTIQSVRSGKTWRDI